MTTRHMATMLGALLGLTGTWLTVRFCLELRTAQDIDTWTAVAIGIGFEACKYLFLVAGLEAWRRGSVGTALAAWLVSAALVVVSVAASMGWLMAADAAATDRSIRETDGYRSLRAQEAYLEREISVLLAVGGEDAERSYRARAIATMAQAEQRRAELSLVTRAMAEAGGAITSSGTPVLASVGAMLGSGPAETRLHAGMAIAVLLEACAGLCLVIRRRSLVVTSTGRTGDTQGPHPDPDRPGPARTRLRPISRGRPSGASADTGVGPGTDTRYRACIEYLRDGGTPSYGAVRRELGCGAGTASRYLSQAVTDGILRREGVRYVLS